jgi:hypothetical protein
MIKSKYAIYKTLELNYIYHYKLFTYKFVN